MIIVLWVCIYAKNYQIYTFHMCNLFDVNYTSRKMLKLTNYLLQNEHGKDFFKIKISIKLKLIQAVYCHPAYLTYMQNTS